MLVKRRVLANVSLGAMFAVVSLFLAVGQVSTAAADTNTLKVSPVRTDTEIKPGESKVVQTTVTNLTNEEISVRPVTNDFVSRDERGTPSLILDENEFAPSHSLKRFMQPLEAFSIPARQSKVIDVTIDVPQNAKPGGYFGAVRFAPTDPGSGGQVNLSASVASIILLTVPGDLVEKLDLTSFTIQQDGKASSYFSNPNNLEAAVRFQNSGNVQLGPFGKLTVSKGDEVVYEADFNSQTPREMTLPDSARRWEIPLDKIGDFGHYTVNAIFTYGEKNQSLEVTKSFWVVPIWAIVAGIVGILLIIGLIVAGILALIRRHKRHGGRARGRAGSRR